MSVRFGAGGALRRVSNWEMYDSVTWAARASSRCSKPNSSNRCLMINETSTGGILPVELRSINNYKLIDGTAMDKL